MSNDKPESTTGNNGLVILREDDKPAPTIREYMAACPVKAGHEPIKADCERYGISLDSPWPPNFPKGGPVLEPIAADPPPAAKILQFPLPFGEDTRAVSNAMARCALFAPVKERQFFKDYVVVGEIDGCLIEWKGEQLNQDDHDTLLQLVKMARGHAFGVEVVQSVNAILNGLGRHTHLEQRRQFFEQGDRLMSGTIRTTPRGKPSYAGHLIVDIITPQGQEAEPRYRRFFAYRLNPKLAGLYNSEAFTLIDWQERLQLKGRGSELAKWLYLWISSHAEQYPHKVETIREKCGIELKDLKECRRQLRRALDLLKETGAISAWGIDAADLVHIERTPSPVQLKHLTKKAAKGGNRRKQLTPIGDLLPGKPKK